jgi:agmatine deiminase
LATIIAKRLKLLDYYLPNFVLEGGSIAVDGEGTLITTEACLLSKGRNPTLNRTDIEEILRDYLGVEKVIWVPHGIYLDETDEHVDNMVAYVKPGEVVMAWTDDEKDPQYAFCKRPIRPLAKRRMLKDVSLRFISFMFLRLPFISRKRNRVVSSTALRLLINGPKAAVWLPPTSISIRAKIS